MNFLEEQTVENNSHESHTLWVEKYRPKELVDYIGNDALKSKIEFFVSSNDIPHILLYGNPGTGKTTLAKLIVSKIKCDFLYINASDENSVENVRTKIKDFSSTVGFKSLKVCILDEADFLSFNAQAALRNLMEAFSKNTRFILTCNYHEKIIPALNSRCQAFAIYPPTKKDVAIHLTKILDKEKVKFKKEDVAFLVNSFYPDIRKIINTAQQGSVNGDLTVDAESIIDSDSKLKMFDLLKSNSDKKSKFQSIRQVVADSQTKDFTDWYKFLYEKIDEYAVGHISPVIVIIAEASYRDSFLVDKEIGFMSAIIQIIQEISN